MRWFDRRPRLTVGLTLFVLFVLIDLSLAAAQDARRDRLLAAFEGAPRLRRPDLYYHHGLVANGFAPDADYRGHHYVFATNSLGFRDRTVRRVPVHRPPSMRYRLLFIGDSFTEGLGVDW